MKCFSWNEVRYWRRRKVSQCYWTVNLSNFSILKISVWSITTTTPCYNFDECSVQLFNPKFGIIQLEIKFCLKWNNLMSRFYFTKFIRLIFLPFSSPSIFKPSKYFKISVSCLNSEFISFQWFVEPQCKPSYFQAMKLCTIKQPVDVWATDNETYRNIFNLHQ